MKGPLESTVEETRKRMRLDESGNPMATVAPELTPEQTAAIEARLKEEKKKRRDEANGRDNTPAPAMEERSIFHGSTTTDYQVHPDPDPDPDANPNPNPNPNP